MIPLTMSALHLIKGVDVEHFRKARHWNLFPEQIAIYDFVFRLKNQVFNSSHFSKHSVKHSINLVFIFKIRLKFYIILHNP